MSELERLVEERTNELKRISRIDVLTSLLNRRGLDDEINKHQANFDNACVLMIDVDSFKQVNDTYGHRTGDDALRKISDLLQESIRDGDIAARIGGDEFLVILPATSPEVGAKIAERLRNSIAQHQFEFNGQALTISLSIGISVGSEHTDFDTLVAQSDKALYRAKGDGKNTVQTYAAS